ncbi:hypothetical protein [Derxia gummosa]|uniref:Uncharacterized protein n=1 Tax=Derxia gummosa DSM 723 TaxID=1121388 RepID=A0A8B6XCE1_9BURK|nr:hypothetical protein [Derxia gummosa]
MKTTTLAGQAMAVAISVSCLQAGATEFTRSFRLPAPPPAPYPVGAGSVAYTDASIKTKTPTDKAGTPGKPVVAGNLIASDIELAGAVIKGGTVTKFTVADPYGIARQSDSGTATISGSISGITITDAEIEFTRTEPDGSSSLVNIKGVTLTNVSLSSLEVPADIDKPQAAPAAAGVAQLDAPKANYLGDRIVLRNTATGFIDAQHPGSPPRTAPRKACFEITSEIPASDTGEKAKLSGLFPSYNWIYRTFNYLTPATFLEGCNNRGSDSDGSGASKSPTNQVALDTQYIIERDQLLGPENSTYRNGWTWGALVVPFKYYPTLREVTTGSAVGVYLGRRFLDKAGESSSFIVSLGLATEKINSTNSGGNPSSRNGLTGAVGYLMTIKDSFNLGFVVGKDWFNRASSDVSGNTYSGRHWISVNLAYELGSSK